MKDSSYDNFKRELNRQVNEHVYSPYERNHAYKMTVMKNPAEKARANDVKSAWKSAAKLKYGDDWKRIARKNGYSV
jgi:glycine betaine/choline ABC-type transport system substrate-binding protein